MICPFCPAVNENGKDRKHQRITVDVLSELRISPSLFEPFLGFLDRSDRLLLLLHNKVRQWRTTESDDRRIPAKFCVRMFYQQRD